MAHVIHVTGEDGREYSVVVDNIASIEYEPGEPGEPPVEEQPEVKDDPGEEPNYNNPQGRPPKKGHPKIEAKDAKEGTPDKAHIKLVGGEILSVLASAKTLKDSLG
jgi:hypothetical protein